MIEVEDCVGCWMSETTQHLFAFTEAVGMAITRRRSGEFAWCPEPWVAKDVRRYARQHPPKV